MKSISRTLRISVASLLTAALLTISTQSPAQSNETPQQRAERLREEAEERAERQRQAEERAERQRQAEERAERQREAEERAERQREAQERAEQQRQAQERAEQQREAQERAQQQREAQERAEQQRQAQERAEQQREAQERAQQQREAQERAEQQRQAQERAQQQREAQERAQQQEREAQERNQQQRQAKERAQQQREAQERAQPQQRQAQEQQNREYTARPSAGAYAVTPAPTRTNQPSSEIRRPSSNGATTVVVRPAAPQPDLSRNALSPSTGEVPAHAEARPTYTVPPTAPIVARTPAGGSTLDPAGSQGILRDLNQHRALLSGLNAKPLPAGSTTVHEGGNVTLQTANGSRYSIRPNGAISSYSSHGTMVSFRPNGKVRSIHTANMEIQRGVHGERTIKTFRKDGAVLVSTGPRKGYLERQAVYQGHSVVLRTYVSAGRTYNRTMVNNFYGVVALPRYVPAVYYPPAFYGWMGSPLAAPVSYLWAWTNQPWFASVQDYFSPDAQYPSGFAWLADYFLSKVLANGYADKSAGYAADLDDDSTEGYEDAYAEQDTPITPPVKAEIAEEVQRQIFIEGAAAAGTAEPSALELAAAMKPNRIFVASGSLDVLTVDQQGCSVSAGDVFMLENPATEDSPMAALRVQASRQGDCPAGALVSVSVQDLQEWQNEMRAQIDAGMAEMRSVQGQKGLPAAPSDAVAPPPRPSMAGLPNPEPGQNVSDLLRAQQRDARQAEAAAVAPLMPGNQ